MFKTTYLITKMLCLAVIMTFSAGKLRAQGNTSDPCVSTTVSTVFPASGPYSTVVDIQGNGFTGTTNVYFNGVSASGFSVVSDNLIKAVVPEDATTGMLTLDNNSCIVNASTFTIISSACGTSAVTTQPVSQSVCENEDAVFSASVSNTSGMTYSWMVLDSAGNWVSVSDDATYTGSATQSLTINDAPLGFMGNQYYFVGTSGTCKVVSHARQLTVSPVPVVIINGTDATCLLPTGSINIMPSIGDGLTYSLDGTNYSADTSITGLATGNYSLYVKSSAGCISIVPFTIQSNIELPDVAAFAVVHPTCEIPTGSIEISGPVSAGLLYSIEGVPFQPGTVFSNLAPGTYHITVQTLLGCTSVTADIVINPVPATPVVATSVPTQPTCEAPTGTIEVTAPLGTQYKYSVDGTTYQASTIFSGLAPGSYTVYVKNGGSCPSQTSTPVAINAVPATPAVANVMVTPPNCNTATGSCEVTAPLGSNYLYSIDGTNWQPATTFANLAVGSYTVYVRDGGSCPSQLASPITINAVPAVPAEAAVIVTPPNCNVATGTCVVTSPVGAQYTYSIDNVNWQSAPNFNNLAAGTYTVYVSDGGSCPSATTTPIVINAVPNIPVAAIVVPTQPTCASPVGSLQVTAPLGSQYSYSLDDVTFQVSPSFSGLAAGTYTVYTKDGSSCSSASQTITLNAVPFAPVAATVTPTHPTCTNVTGSLQVMAPIGSNYTYSIDGSNYQSATMFDGLAEGTYTVYVKDGSSCASAGTTATINAIPNMPDPAVAFVTQPTCSAGGIIEVMTPTGYAYSINGGAWQASRVFTDLAPGDYVISCQNAQGCTSTSVIYTVLADTAVLPEITSTEGCEMTAFGKGYVINAEPANNTFDANTATYAWKNEQGTIVGTNDSAFNVTEYLSGPGQNAQFPLQFTLTVTNANGCTSTFPFVVEASLCGIPKGISPNNDGKNDRFDLVGMNAGTVSIFNRYGEKVFSKNNYRNEWIGQGDNGGELPSGTYYYVIENGGTALTGWVYVNREEN